MKGFPVLFAIAAILSVILSCNLPTESVTQNQTQPTVSLASNPAQTSPPPVSINHVTVPADINSQAALNYDVDSAGTGPEHRAPYGDSYNINLFERPFTQKDMNYVPDLDIRTFQITSDDHFNYVTITLIGTNPNNPIGIDYGVEIDKDRDGFGDALVWAQPPYGTQWTTNGVKVYTDSNHDTGGASPEKSDADVSTGTSYPGNGYDTLVFDQGQGSDPDLAWVRIDPRNSNVVDFAFKATLSGPTFMWGVWADAGLKDPSKFNYNDRFTPEQAGSPIAGYKYYPIQAIYAVDNTCRAAQGFAPNGYEPLICPPLTQPAPSKVAGPTQPSVCQPPIGGCGLHYEWHQDICKCVEVLY